MNFQSPIYTEKTQCQDCYKCIRECPVKAIRVERGHAMVVSELCVFCGHCVLACPAGAKKVRDDLSRARQLLSLKGRVILSLAPSFASEFAGIGAPDLAAAIRALGFFGVSETAIGADLVSARLAADFSSLNPDKPETPRLFLSSACPSAVEFVKQCLPDLAPSLTDRASPLLAHARFLRETYGDDIGVVFAGPCVAKKREADAWPDIDCAISFADLRSWLSSAGLVPAARAENPPLPAAGQGSADAPDFIPWRAASGAFYPVDGGMIASIKRGAGKSRVRMMTVSGLSEIRNALSGLDPASLDRPLFMELLACPGGCVNGPLVSAGQPSALRRMRLLEYAETAPDAAEGSASGRKAPDLSGTLPKLPTPLTAHLAEEIRGALRSVGKVTARDELNCGSCGYDTCRAFAAAMLDERAEKTMCLSYMRKLAQKKANGLIRAMPSGVVICDSELKIVECNENFARLMGEDILSMYEAKPGMEGADLAAITGLSSFCADAIARDGPDVSEHEFRERRKIFQATVFSIEKGESACAVVQDVTAPQVRRDRVIRQTRKVIDKNLAVVQKIAYLLGENAAETEATLNSIIESFSVGEGEP